MTPPKSIRTLKLGNRSITIHGFSHRFWQDLYHYSMSVSWPVFFGVIALLFIGINAGFALLYLLGDTPIDNLSPDGFWGAFFFSIETLATVGYGDMHPITVYAHILSSIETFAGMSSLALFTGMIFTRFSKPRALIIFANHPVICPVDGQQTLMIRTGNARLNEIIDASAKLRLIRSETSPEGLHIRRLYDLHLKRDQHPVFQLGWTIMHVIDEHSPLSCCTPEGLAATQTEFILTLEGIDEATNQTMRSRKFYHHDTIRWQHRYADVLITDQQGNEHMHYANFHEVLPIG